MIPIRDDNPQLAAPLVTLGIVVLNVLSWLSLQGLGTEEPLARSICELGLVPGELLGRASPGSSVPLGRGFACVVDPQPMPITLLSHMFLHGGWMHLIGNLWFLWIFGGNVEDSMGHLRFALFYLLAGLAAAAAQIAAAPDSAIPMVGASGAIGGVMGAYVVLYPRVWVHLLLWFGFYVTRIAVPAYFMLGYWLLLQLIGGAFSLGAEASGVAFWAHTGGFLAGALLVYPFRNPVLLERHPYHGWSRGRPAQPRWDRDRGGWL